MVYCFQNSDCGGDSKGICVNGFCECINFWTGTNCEETWVEYLGRPWNIYIYFFGCLFGIIWILSTIQILRFIRTSPGIDTQKLLHILVFLEALDECVYLFIDPTSLRGLVPPISRSILNGLTIYFITAMYIMILMFWCEVYYHSNMSSLFFVKKLRPVFIAFFIVTLAIEVTFRVLYTLNFVPEIMYGIYTIFIITLCAGTGSAFLYYGPKLHRNLARFATLASSAIDGDGLVLRLKRIYHLTLGSTFLMFFISIAVIVINALQIWVFGVRDPFFYLIQNFCFRFLMAACCVNILWALRHDEKPLYERVPDK